jgi:hypothetical protein
MIYELDRFLKEDGSPDLKVLILNFPGGGGVTG